MAYKGGKGVSIKYIKKQGGGGVMMKIKIYLSFFKIFSNFITSFCLAISNFHIKTTKLIILKSSKEIGQYV